jgi:hypothetical protein
MDQVAFFGDDLVNEGAFFIFHAGSSGFLLTGRK